MNNIKDYNYFMPLSIQPSFRVEAHSITRNKFRIYFWNKLKFPVAFGRTVKEYCTEVHSTPVPHCIIRLKIVFPVLHFLLYRYN